MSDNAFGKAAHALLMAVDVIVRKILLQACSMPLLPRPPVAKPSRSPSLNQNSCRTMSATATRSSGSIYA